MIEQAFEVAADFNFDIGSALLNTKTLTGAVDGLSQSANSALTNIGFLASGLVAHLGLGSGSLLSVLSAAVRTTEEFDMASLTLSNNITQNFDKLTGTIDTFNDRLGTSQMILNNISDTAKSVGLDSRMLENLTTKLASPLAQNGRLGVNYGGAINLSKNLLLAAENTQINPMAASESLYMALTGVGALHGQLFQRLANTQAFKQAHITNQPQLMRMMNPQKIDLLTKALSQLATDADALAFRLGTLRAQFTILMDNVRDILLPIGQAIKAPLVKVLQELNGYLKENGRQIGQAFGQMLTSIFENPRALLINILQLRDLGHDVKRSFELVGWFRLLAWVLELVGIQFKGGLLLAAIRGLGSAVSYLWAAVPWGTLFSAIKWVAQGLASFAGQFTAVLFFLQILSRASAIAKVNDLVAIPKLLPQLAQIGARFKAAISNILHPLTAAMDFWANLLAPIFEWSNLLKGVIFIFDKFTDVLEFLGSVMAHVEAALSGIVNVLINAVSDIYHARNPFKHMAENWDEGVDTFLRQNAKRLGMDGMQANYHVEQNNHIEARFDFREQMEPDRIAFKVTEHLMKLAANPRQSRGNSMRAVFGNAAVAVTQ